jgi:hypothetical protein
LSHSYFEKHFKYYIEPQPTSVDEDIAIDLPINIWRGMILSEIDKFNQEKENKNKYT